MLNTQPQINLPDKASPELLDVLNAGLCVLNKDMDILWINKVQESWFAPCKEIVGKKCYETFEKRDHICIGCPVIKSFRDKKTHISNLRTVYLNGEKRYFRIAASPILNPFGEADKVLELVIDITEKRKNEVETRRLNANTRKMNKILKNLANERANELRLADEELRTIFELGNRLVSSLEINEVLQTIVNTVPNFLNVSGCIVRVFDETRSKLILEAASGLSGTFVENTESLKIGEGISGIAAKSGVPIAIADISCDNRVKHLQECIKEGIRSLLVVPIAFKNNILGTIAAYSRDVKSFTASEINLISTFAIHAAIALNNAKLHKKIQLSYYSTIAALVNAVEAKDPYTSGHSERVTNYALKIAKELNLGKRALDVLAYSGKLHDIGKIAIPDSILQKPGPLTPLEMAEVETHPVKGVEMVRSVKFLEKCFSVIRHHHERYDGKGYPDRLKGKEIPVLSRILAVADAFDAMTSKRPYRKGLKIDEAMVEIEKNLGKQFDSNIGSAFLGIFKK
ncbi:MAG: HD domain-containing protein [Candidatus Omnitrophica bacterium]|nr:HD domain-containing protein [Candidatus Omnitrophota bacterium]